MENKNGRPETEAARVERLKARVAYLEFMLAGGKSGRVSSAANRERSKDTHGNRFSRTNSAYWDGSCLICAESADGGDDSGGQHS